MPRMQHTLFDSFEKKGVWWLPDYPDNKFPGILNYDAGNIKLELFGSLRPPERQAYNDSSLFTPSLIMGLCDSQYYSLYRTVEKSRSLPVPGSQPRSTFNARFLFKGLGFEAPEDLTFLSASINFSDLENWLHQEAIFTKTFKRRSKRVEQKEYRHPKPFRVSIPTLNATIRSETVLTGQSSLYTNRWEHHAFLRIEPKEAQSFDWFFKVQSDLRNLITFFAGRPSFTRSFTVYSEPEEIAGRTIKPDAQVYFGQAADRLDEDNYFWDMLILYPHIQDRIHRILKAWFRNAERLRTVFDLFFGTFYNKNLYLRFQFLSLMQALESYDRIVNDSSYVSDKEYEKIKQALTNAFPSGMDHDLKASLKSRIKYGNEHSLRKRLKKLFADLQPDTVKLVADDSSRFVGTIVDSRNYFTHLSEELESSAILEGSELFYTTHRLRIFLTILLLRELEIDEPSIVSVIQNNSKLNFIYQLPSKTTTATAKEEVVAPPKKPVQKKSTKKKP